MTKLILITVVIASCVFLMPGISIASDYASDTKGYQDTTIASVTSDSVNPEEQAFAPKRYQDTTITSVTSDSVNPEEQAFAAKGYQDATTSYVAGNSADAKNHISNTHAFCTSINKDCSKVCGRFRMGLSYPGSCCSLPKGAICLIYSDNYNWVVSDIRIDPVPLIVGVINCKPIELIRCYDANYYHVLGTSLIMSTPRAS
jgi:hypothetical protein